MLRVDAFAVYAEVERGEDRMTTKTLELTRSQAKNLAEFIEFNIFDYIRNDTEIDNIYWLFEMSELYKTLEAMVEQFDREGVEE